MENNMKRNSINSKPQIVNRFGRKIKKRNNTDRFSKLKKGWFQIGDKKCYMHSAWERNYSRYLEFLKRCKKIRNWEYEPETFWFKQIKRGVRSYTPDFKVFKNDGSIEFHEVKGYMDPHSRTKLKRMVKYHPGVKLILIGQDTYRAIAEYKSMIPGWED